MNQKVFSVMIFGFIGGTLRSFIQHNLSIIGSIPLTVLFINFIGALFLGILTGGLLTYLDTSEAINVGLTTGLLGGFTTFSTLELSMLPNTTHTSLILLILYLLLSIIIGPILATIGQRIGIKILNNKRWD